MLRRQKHGINKEMIYDALDAAGVEELPVAEPITPSKQGQLSPLLIYVVSLLTTT